MNELIEYLIDQMYIDFQGEITIDRVKTFLRDDDGREARALMGKLLEEKAVDDLLITLADCLKENLRTGIKPDVVREQLKIYAES